MKQIQLTKGQVALVDDADFEWLSRFKWYAKWCEDTESFYAIRNSPMVDGKTFKIRMHRQIIGAPPGIQVDHENHDTLDNRWSNLRLASRNQNQWNTGKQSNNASGFKGVSWQKRAKKWQAHITVAGKHSWLGLFNTPTLAHEAYVSAAKQLHGDFYHEEVVGPTCVAQSCPQYALIAEDLIRLEVVEETVAA